MIERGLINVNFLPSTSEILQVAQEQGMTIQKFALRFGISESTARQWLKSVGCKKFIRRKRSVVAS